MYRPPCTGYYMPFSAFHKLAIALAWAWLPYASHAAICPLDSMDAQLLAPELRSDTPQYAENGYRKQLLRFVNAYYSQLAGDLLRGNGEYLAALHRLMGSTDPVTCTAIYRELLLTEGSSQDLGLALWSLRTAQPSSVLAGPESATVQQE